MRCMLHLPLSAFSNTILPHSVQFARPTCRPHEEKTRRPIKPSKETKIYIYIYMNRYYSGEAIELAIWRLWHERHRISNEVCPLSSRPKGTTRTPWEGGSFYIKSWRDFCWKPVVRGALKHAWRICSMSVGCYKDYWIFFRALVFVKLHRVGSSTSLYNHWWRLGKST